MVKRRASCAKKTFEGSKKLHICCCFDTLMDVTGSGNGDGHTIIDGQNNR